MQRPFLDLPDGGPVPPGPARVLLANLLVATAYALTGYAGLKLAFVGHVVTLFWPPSGIAFAAIWLGGYRLAPGVMAGAFAVNMVVLGAPPLAMLVAIGNLLPALASTIVLRTMIARRDDPSELWRVLAFILVAALGATTLSATVGSLAINAAGLANASLQSTWLVWWMGDAMGVLIAGLPILLWRRFIGAAIGWQTAFDIFAFALAGLGIIAGLLLIRDPVWAVELMKLFTLLLSLWAGTRFGLTGPALVTLMMAVGAVAVTMLGVGPFARTDFYDSFALLHSYLFAQAIAGMLLAAALADLRRAAHREALARADAEAASANRIRLLTMISHDVRNPLAGMMGVLASLDQQRLGADAARLVGLGLRAGGTLTTLVNDILDVARADAGRIRLEPAPFSPARSLADIVDLNRAPATTRGLAIAATGLGDLPAAVDGDRARFEQLIGNLVANAIAYTPAGRVEVRATFEPAAALPLVVEVIDTGPGIEPEAARTMFNAFAVAPRPGNRSAGLGLGLHICGRLVTLMAGRIDYARTLSGGSRFVVALPLPAVPPTPAPPAVPDPMQAVLLVEDDPVAREVTAALLTRLGHRVAVAADGDAALALAATQPFDLVLLDLQLGAGDDGVGVARRIRALPGAAGRVVIVALTADATATERRACLAAGMDGVLVKPFDLGAGLGSALAAARSRDFMLS